MKELAVLYLFGLCFLLIGNIGWLFTARYALTDWPIYRSRFQIAFTLAIVFQIIALWLMW